MSTSSFAPTILPGIARADLSAVTARLARDGVNNAAILEQEFRKFATLLALHPELDLAPSGTVDEYWHALILDTRRYHAFCTGAVGGFVHHVPGNTGEMHAEFTTTLRLYEARFGVPDPALWSSEPHSMAQRRL